MTVPDMGKKNNNDFIKNLTAESVLSVSTSSENRWKIMIAAALLVMFLIVSGIVIYMYNDNFLSLIGIAKDKVEETETVEEIKRKQQLIKLTRENRLLEKDKKKLEESLESIKKENNDVFIEKQKLFDDLDKQNKIISTELTSVKKDMIDMKKRKKKLDKYTRKLIAEKELMSKDVNKIVEFKTKAEKSLWKKEKDEFEAKIKELKGALKDKETRLEDSLNKLEEMNLTIKREHDSSESVVLKSKIDKIKEVMHYNYGTFYSDLHMYEKAVNEYKTVLELNPDDIDSHYNIAVIYDIHLRNKDLAAYHYKRYLDLSPGAQDAENVRNWLLKNEKKN